VNKKFVLVAAGVGLVSFTGAFATGWLTRPASALGSPAPGRADDNRVRPASLMPPTALTATPGSADEGVGTRAMSQQQLNELIYEVREKIQEYNRKLRDLEKEKERLRSAQQTLKKDIDTLNALRVDLAASVANLKNERDALLKARVEVEQVEKTNLLAIAAAYDKMDAVGAAEILTNMAVGKSKNGGSVNPNANIDDAVKILHFMQERTKAKVLAEIATTEPALAATLSLKLKQVTEAK
jgi:flagellar motility protein MotE (MotC chaperone)